MLRVYRVSDAINAAARKKMEEILLFAHAEQAVIEFAANFPHVIQ